MACSLLHSDGSAISPEHAPFAEIPPPSVARGWKIAGYPLSGGLTRDDYRESFAKMAGLVSKLHQAGGPILTGTDGYGLELVRELELYQQAGLANGETLQTATIVPARLTDMVDRTGSITPGKTADIILVDGDVSKDITTSAMPPCRYRVPRRLPPEWEGPATGNRSQRNAPIRQRRLASKAPRSDRKHVVVAARQGAVQLPMRGTTLG